MTTLMTFLQFLKTVVVEETGLVAAQTLYRTGLCLGGDDAIDVDVSV